MPTLIAWYKHSYLIRPDIIIFLDAGCDIVNQHSTDYDMPAVYNSFFFNLLIRIQLTSDVIARAASVLPSVSRHRRIGRIDGGGARSAGWARVPHCCGYRPAAGRGEVQGRGPRRLSAGREPEKYAETAPSAGVYGCQTAALWLASPTITHQRIRLSVCVRPQKVGGAS